MSASVVAHARANSLAAPTVGAIDSSGATLCVANVATWAASSTLTTDSLGNTWTAKTARVNSGIISARPFYKYNGTVGSGHTITPGTGSQFEVEFAALSGVGDFVSESAGGNGGSTSQQPAACSGTFGLLITGLEFSDGNNTNVAAIDSSYSIIDQKFNVASTNPGGALAWKETSSTDNPTWSWTNPSGGFAAAWQMAFAAGGGGGSPITRSFGAIFG